MNYNELLSNYDFTKTTKIAAVIGDPVNQSLSPYLHNYWIEKYKIDGIYISLKVSKEELPEFLKSLPDVGFSGCNITIPHKEAALKLCNFVSKSARQIGAVNTIFIDDNNKIFGDNSDHFGFIESINKTHKNIDFISSNILLLGAGGAARAIIFGLLKQGAKNITIANRSLSKAQKIADDFNFAENKEIIKIIPWQEKDSAVKDCDILINSTSLGMVGKDQLEVNLTNLKKSALVCDIVYKPLMTKLLTTAKNQGNPILPGIKMLIYQGILGFEKWFEVRPKVDEELVNKMIEISKQQ
jgi:shikimate dehydrogenase